MALDWWINIGCWVSVPPLYRKDNAVYLPCRLPRYSLLVHCCKRAKHFKALDLETSGSQPGRPWGQLSQTSRGKNLSLSNFIENMSLCLKCSLFQFVNAKLKKKKPLASFSAIHPHFAVSHFLGAGGIFFSGRRWLGSVVSLGTVVAWERRLSRAILQPLQSRLSLYLWHGNILSPLEKDSV